MNEFKVKNIIIGKQSETCENYDEFVKMVKKKSIKVRTVEMGQRINIEKNIYFDVLWPSRNNLIIENGINNNSLVCRLMYKDFSMLFTGDIEKIAEEEILKTYKKNTVDFLKSTVLKVAHHGSKTSSTNTFLEAVMPKIALIGVGKNNNFGHPSNSTLENLNYINSNIYRTDKNGEIVIHTNGRKIKIKNMIK